MPLYHQKTYLCKINTNVMAENNGKHTTINPEGKTTLTIVAVLFFVINLPLFLITPIYGWWSYLALTITLLFVWFFLHFFRNPVRRFPSDDTEKVVVSPADGTTRQLVPRKRNGNQGGASGRQFLRRFQA